MKSCALPRLLLLGLVRVESQDTPELYPIAPAAGLPFFVELKASFSILLSYQDRVRVVDAAVNCGQSTGNGTFALHASENTKSLRGPLAEDAFGVGEAGQTGNFQTSLRWGTERDGMLKIMNSGNYRVCLCAGVGAACKKDGMFGVTVGTFTVAGPSRLLDGTSNTLSPVAGQKFNLQVMGHGMTTNDRIRLVDSDIPCGSPESALNTKMLGSGRLTDVSESGPVGIAGLTGDTASSQMWMSLMISAAGEYNVCWCSGFLRPSGFCRSAKDFEVYVGAFNTVGALPNGIAIMSTGSPVPSGKILENITGLGQTANIGDGFDLYITGYAGLSTDDRIRLVDSDVKCGEAGSSRNTVKLAGSSLAMSGEIAIHSDINNTEDMMTSLRWKGLSLSAVGSYRVCLCPALGGNCDANTEFMVDTGSFDIVDTSASGAWMLARDDQCQDDSAWKSPYGEDCSWHLRNDPGCRKFRDMGQLKNCPSACHNCDGAKPLPSELKTTCTMTSLCECYSTCDPPAPCPVGDESHNCVPVVVEGSAVRRADWLDVEVAELEGGNLEPILGVQVMGDANSQHHVTTFKVQISTIAKPDEFEYVDEGRIIAANWEGRSALRIYFAQGATPAKKVRIIPVDWAGSPAISAKLVHKRCKQAPLPEDARTSECQALMCKAYCHKRLGCEGEFVDYCEMRKKVEVVGAKACEVDCNGAPTQAVYLGLVAAPLLLAFM